jgi:hypothetical protein
MLCLLPFFCCLLGLALYCCIPHTSISPQELLDASDAAGRSHAPGLAPAAISRTAMQVCDDVTAAGVSYLRIATARRQQ